MKKTALILISFLAFINFANSQTSDNGFHFQGYAVDPEGKALGSESVTVKFEIYPSGQAVVYSEEIDCTTDLYGVFTAVIGSEYPEDFAKINFSTALYKLKVEVKKTSAGSYTEISNAPFYAVPYARSAYNGVPVGSIIPFGGPRTAIPDGWLACDGASKNQADFPQLFAVIDTYWGGDATTFKVPDLRGYFLRGMADGEATDPNSADRTDKSGGTTIGDQVGSYQEDQFDQHNHSGDTGANGNHRHLITDACNVSGTFDDGTDTDDVFNASSTNIYTDYSGNHTHSIDNQGGDETRPKNAYVWFIIKY